MMSQLWIIEDIETYLCVSAGRYDEAGEAENLLEEALKALRILQREATREVPPS
jgi:hypothetical protein